MAPPAALGPDQLAFALAARAQSVVAAPPPRLTRKEKVERYIAHVISHEIGHTLGLRHNFKGSMIPPSSSTMEYVLDEDAILLPGPAAYDIDAIKLLYTSTTTPPAQPFCNDDTIWQDPDCTRFDRGADPLNDFYKPLYSSLTFYPGFPLIQQLLRYVGHDLSYARRLDAWNLLRLRSAFSPTPSFLS